jgi:aryl-alcohol dehydrogenase-like predicted oxidoreductase
MRTRQLGHTNLFLTTVGFGTWAIGGADWDSGWGPQDDADSIAAIHRALELGVNWIDTAAIYGVGHAEEVVGRAIAGRRQEVMIATKCGRHEGKNGQIYGRLKADSIRQEAEDSLRRLNIEVIDLYQIHWPDPDEDIEEAWRTIADLIKEGKVQYGGVSNFNVEQLKRIQPIHPVASLQPPYSLLERGVEQELLNFCAANKIGVIAYSPMQAGLLTGKYDKEQIADLPDSDWRKEDEHFQEPEISANLEFIDKLQAIAKRSGYTLPQLAIAWVLRRREVTAAIVGARHPSQIEETAQAAKLDLSAKDNADINELLREREQKLKRQQRNKQ